MAKMEKPVDLNVVQAFRGIVDFYYWKGMPVARSWPKKAIPTESPAFLRTHADLRAMHAYVRAAPIGWHEMFAKIWYPARYKALQLKRSLAMKMAQRNINPTPVEIDYLTCPVQDGPRHIKTFCYLKAGSPKLDLDQKFFLSCTPEDINGQQWTIRPPTEDRYLNTRTAYTPVFDHFTEATLAVYQPFTHSYEVRVEIATPCANLFVATVLPGGEQVPVTPALQCIDP